MKTFCLMTVSLAIALAACATLDSAANGKGTGTARTYNVRQDAAWNAVVETVKATDLTLVSEDKARGVVLARRGISGDSAGENVAVFVEPQGEAHTRIEVVSRRTWALSIGAPNWEKILLARLDKRL